MKARVFVLSGLAGLLAGLCSSATVVLAQTPDATGRMAKPGEKMAAPKMAAPSHACLQLNNGGAVFNFNVTFNPNANGFPITGGTISGTLCGAPTWKVTGGHLGPNLAITAAGNASGCATKLTVTGNFANPSSYTGKYGFPGTAFSHHTLFVGYLKGSCP